MAVNLNIPSQVKPYANLAAFPATGAVKTIYIAEDTNKTYRWTGSTYVEISATAASTWGGITGTLSNQTDLQNALNTKQDTLISGTNVKTIEGQSILGSGNIDLTKSDVGLSNVDNTSDANKPISTATQTALNGKENTITAGTTSQYFRGDKTFQTLDKTAVGLGNVDNTSDANKPISTATQTALNAKQDTLVSGTNIKTINGTSVLGNGNISISTGLTVGTTPITSGTIGRVLFQGTGNVLQQSSSLFWDNTNERLGIGTSTPSRALDIVKTIASGAIEGIKIEVNHSSSTSAAILDFVHTQFDARFRIQSIAGAGGANPTLSFIVRSSTLAMSILQSGNVNIGNTTTDAGFKLDVNGTARVQTSIQSPSVVAGATNGFGFALWVGNTARFENGANFGTVGTIIHSGTDMYYNNISTGNLIFRTSTNVERFRVFGSTGNIGINTTTDIASAILNVNSTTQGFLPPRMTTTQKNAITTPATGLQVFDTTLNQMSYYNGTTWINL